MEHEVANSGTEKRDGQVPCEAQEARKIAVKSELTLSGSGVAILKIQRENGTVETVVAKNLITDHGLDIIVRNLANFSPVQLTHIVVSDATTNPSASETTMPGTNKWALAATVSRPSARQVQWSCAFARGAIVGTIGSIGLCGDASGNNLFARIKIDPPKPVGANDTVEVTYLLIIQRSG